MMETLLPREIYLVIGILVFASIIFLLFFSNEKKDKNNEIKKDSFEELGKEVLTKLNLAITYAEMKDKSKAKKLLDSIKISELKAEEKSLYELIQDKLK
tara:strand:+ start:282 stop:578 length:297 start_codon:yes stop_codon:yes gene_type:complete